MPRAWRELVPVVVLGTIGMCATRDILLILVFRNASLNREVCQLRALFFSCVLRHFVRVQQWGNGTKNTTPSRCRFFTYASVVYERLNTRRSAVED